jgi:hypothetical protein
MKQAFFIICSAIFIFISCEENKNENKFIQKGDRHLGIHVTETEALDFEQSFLIAKEAGMDCIPQVFYWNMLEDSGAYDPDHLLEIINLFYPVHDMAVSLCISPIAAISRAVPEDLQDVSFGDPVMIARFKQLLDTVYHKTPNLDLRFLLLGNEVDLYFSSHPEEWEDYTTFVKEIVPYAKQYWPDMMVGVENTLGGSLGPDKNHIKNINAHTDMVCFTYYPLNADFTMQPVEAVKQAIDEIIELYADRTLFLEECGYATSEHCNSSEEAQADFVEEMFEIWDSYANRLVYVGLLWLHDIPEETARFYVNEYGMKGQPNELAFKEYLRTTGLRTSNGKDKKGYQTLKKLAEQRGW